MQRMEKESPKVELMATISLDVSNLKDNIEGISAETKEQKEILTTLKTNLEANQAILEKNLKSFEERLKRLAASS